MQTTTSAKAKQFNLSQWNDHTEEVIIAARDRGDYSLAEFYEGLYFHGDTDIAIRDGAGR